MGELRNQPPSTPRPSAQVLFVLRRRAQLGTSVFNGAPPDFIKHRLPIPSDPATSAQTVVPAFFQIRAVNRPFFSAQRERKMDGFQMRFPIIRVEM